MTNRKPKDDGGPQAQVGPQHMPVCNYPGKPVGSPGCICLRHLRESVAQAQGKKHWPDCGANHGGACDMGEECGT